MTRHAIRVDGYRIAVYAIVDQLHTQLPLPITPVTITLYIAVSTAHDGTHRATRKSTRLKIGCIDATKGSLKMAV